MKKESISTQVLGLFQSYKLAMRTSLKANELGLNAMHVKCLSYIHNAKSCTANEMVNNLNRDKAQIARLVKEMIDKNWLIKTSNPEDKRSQVLSLTKAGNNLARLINSTHAEINTKMVENLTIKEISEFSRICSVISNNLKNG